MSNTNTGNWNTGYCNTITPDDLLIFNKMAKRIDWDKAQKPEWMRAQLTRWVCAVDMSDAEKEAYPSYVTTGGYLKSHTSLKSAFVEAWEKATPEDRALTFKLPNFDAVVFQEVFGFNPLAYQNVKMTVDGIEAELTADKAAKVKEILGI